jgi:hypothetical protein
MSLSPDAIELNTAANGLAWITTFSSRQSRRLSLLLMFRYGFWRWGIWIPAITDEAIFPDFVRFRLRVLAGYDHWMGYHLLADNPGSDVFLRQFYAKHCRADH